MTDKLQAYNEKRDFGKTAEPKGGTSSGDDRQFVVQLHYASRTHYDFRLEHDGVLVSWAVPKGPSFNPKDKRLAVRTEDHPYDYKDFEGTIPKGEYGGGTVLIWDRGTWEEQEDFAKGIKEGSVKIVLHGERLQGKWALVRMKTEEKQENWLLIKEKDAFAQNKAGIEPWTTSVVSGLDKKGMEERTEEDLFPEKVKVQLCETAEKPPAGDAWGHEIKYDGYRILLEKKDGKTRLLTRNQNDFTDRFPLLKNRADDWDKDGFLLDGEVVLFDEAGKTDFQTLQQAIKGNKDAAFRYMAFDALYLNGRDLRGQTLQERKKQLEAFLKNVPKELVYSPHVEGNGAGVWQSAKENQLEGIISKKLSAKYTGGRNRNWIKSKLPGRDDFLVAGFTQTEDRKNGISALLFGEKKGNDWVYAGRAGTGFTEEERLSLYKELQKITRKTPVLKEAPKKRAKESVYWVSEKWLAEVKFTERTQDGHLRHPVFLGLRKDADPKEVRAKKAPAKRKTADKTSAKTGVKLSSPDKILYPKETITKEEVFSYYEAIADHLMSELKNRLVSLVRCPDGAAEECFYQKHPNASDPYGARLVEESDGDKSPYIVLEDKEQMLLAVQMNTLEFHIWGSRAEKMEKPDRCVFDLDPDEGVSLDTLRDNVRKVKSLLDELELESFLLTSGGKGYHIVVPLTPAASFDAVHAFAKNVAAAAAQKWPERFTDNMSKQKRKGKVYLDFHRNRRGATAICPFSLRAREKAAIAWPIRWDDLDTTAPQDITIHNWKEKEIGWKDYGKKKQKLKSD